MCRERGFRSQYCIKTKFRNSQSNTNLTKLILISELGPPSEQFDFNSCYQVERDEAEETEYRERTEHGDEREKGPLKERRRMLMQLKEMTTKRGEGERDSIYTAM